MCIPQCPENCPEVLEYSAANVNLAGIGVFEGQSDNEFQFRGIRSPDADILVELNTDLNTIDLSIISANIKSTVVFDNAADRASTVPNFEGQFGYQLNTGVPYVAYSTTVGEFKPASIFVPGSSTTLSPFNGTELDLVDKSVLVFSSAGTGGWNYEDCFITFNNVSQEWTGACNVLFYDNSNFIVLNTGKITINGAGLLDIAGSGVLNFDPNSEIHLSNVIVPASSVLITSTTAGEASSKPLTEFISTFQTQTGWGAPTGTATRTAFDTASVTLPQLAERVKALIDDLKAVRLPAT